MPKKSRQEIILIGCGSSKQPSKWRGPAKDLYTGNLFRARRKFAERFTSLELRRDALWYILSAKHVLLLPNQEVGYYDESMKTLSQNLKAVWPLRAAYDLYLRPNVEFGARVHLHMGREYAERLEPCLRAAGFRVEWPLRGMGIGEQLEFYKNQKFPIRTLLEKP